jgi:TPP-dependent pyruvate/acetoin dehydrogenase alpha subunit
MLAARLRTDMYAWMSLTRAFDETMVAMWKSGRGLGGTFSQRGHEAISVGAGLAFGPDDVSTPMHRDLGTYLVLGMTPERIFGNLLGRATGPSRGRDSNLHGMGDLSLGIIGFISHIPQALPTALGVAMSFRYRSEPRVAITFVGDGGTTAGPFHEVLNMAALWNAPLVTVVENNRYAYSTPLDQQMGSHDFVAKAQANGVRGVVVDGNDVEAVYVTVQHAVEAARAGEGPTLIQADTMRMLGHAIHDGAEYVPADLLAEWELRDPLTVQRRRLIEHGVATSEALDSLDRAARERIARAVESAEAAPFPDPDTVTDWVYA